MISVAFFLFDGMWPRKRRLVILVDLVWLESLDSPSLTYCLCGEVVDCCTGTLSLYVYVCAFVCMHGFMWVPLHNDALVCLLGPLKVTDLPGLQVLTPSSWQLSCKRCPSSRLPLPPLPPACPPPPQRPPAPVSQDHPPSARNGTAARRVQGGGCLSCPV